MLNIQRACELATKVRNEPFVTAVIEVARGFVVATTAIKGEVPDVSPLFVNKETGEIEYYFIPDHFDEIDNGKSCVIPEQFR